ncbi:MAG: lamin tail domain-containing protein [Planctomycetota bacterium]
MHGRGIFHWISLGFCALLTAVTPSSAYSGLIISEVMFSPGVNTTDPGSAWVEIYNAGNTEEQLGDYNLIVNPGGSGLLGGAPLEFALSSHLLDRGEFVVLFDQNASNAMELRSFWNIPTSAETVGVGSGSWSDGLLTPDFALTRKSDDSFVTGTPQFTQGFGNYSYFLTSLNADGSNEDNWELAGGLNASPGDPEASAVGIGTPGRGPSVVPEPSSLLMMGMGAFVLFRRRRPVATYPSDCRLDLS